jgi:Domain of unknown function DUF87.
MFGNHNVSIPESYSTKNLLNLSYCDTLPLEINDSLFWQKQTQYTLLPTAKNDKITNYYFFLADNQVEFHQKQFLWGEYTYAQFTSIKGKIGKGTALKIFPSYFYDNENYQTIIEVIEVKSLQALKSFIFEVLQSRNCSIKIIQELIEQKQFSSLLKKQLLSIQDVDKQDLMKKMYYTFEQNKIEEYINKFLHDDTDIFGVQLLVLIKATNLPELTNEKKRLKTLAATKKIKIKQEFFLQKQYIEKFFLQRISLQKESTIYMTKRQFNQLMQVGQIGLFDQKGRIIGEDNYRNPVVFNLWQKDIKRVNHNFVIIGQSGQGKTTLLNTLLFTQTEAAQVFILDPENEYVHIIHEKTYQHYELDLNTTFNDLLNFSEINQNIAPILEDFERKTKADYPIIQKFEALLKQYVQEYPEISLCMSGFAIFIAGISNIILIQTYVEELLIRNIINIDDNTDYHHFILKEILQKSTQNTHAIIYDTLSYIWRTMVKTSGRKLLIIDEAYILFNQNDEKTIELLRNIYKRARKYNISVGIVTQNILDFTHEKYLHLLMPILDNSVYKFIFYQGEKDLQYFANYYGLSELELNQFKQLHRGSCMLVIGEQFGKVVVKQYVET